MKIKDLIKRFVAQGAIIYTVGSLSIMLISLLISQSESVKLIEPQPYFYFALFSYLMSLGSVISLSKAFPAPTGRAIHAICYIGGFFLFVMLIGNSGQYEQSNISFAVAVIFTVIFAIFYTVGVILAHFISKKKNSDLSNTQKPADKALRSAKTKKEKVKVGSKQKESTYKNRFS